MSAELAAITAAALVPLLTVQVRVRGQKRRGIILKQVTRGRSWTWHESTLHLVRHHLNHLDCTSFDPVSAELGAIITAALILLLTVQVHVVENEGESSNKRRAAGRGLGTKVLCTRASSPQSS